MKRRAFGVAGLGLVFALGSGCGEGGSVETLHFWAMGREAEVIQELLPEFEREHPGIHVEVEQLPWTAAHEKLLTAVAGDSTPDLCQLGNSWIPEFVTLKALAPLERRIAASKTIARDDYFPGVWDVNVAGERLYGLPWYVDTRLLFYRTDLLAAAGYTAPPGDWAQWRQQLAAIRRQSGGDRYGVLLPLNEYDSLIALSLQQAAPLLREDGARGNFATPDFERVLTFYVDMFRLGYAPPVSNSQISNTWTEFGRGYFSFYITGPWNIGEFKRRLPPELDGKWMTAPLPGPDGPGASSAGGASLAIFRRSRHPDAAWALIEFLSRPGIQQRFHALTGNLPPRRASWQGGVIAADPYARAFRDQLERVKPTPKVAEWERIATEMRLVTELVVRGDLSVHAAALELDRRADRILAKRRELLAAGVSL
jgi:multiple sugar transport system substrate-binding protein